jgi:hypothetical protein
MKPILLGHDARGSAVELSGEDRETHMHVIGSSGSGKSKFLEQMMRGDLANRQGFCLIDPHGVLYNDVLSFCAHKVLNREVVLLNLSEPSQVIGFNPFKKESGGDVSVQVGRRIQATMHAWGVENTDQTPTLERTLRLIFTTLLELGLSFHQAQHLINFQSGEVREQLIEKLSSPLIRAEWEELMALKPKEWRAEMLSAKNRLFRLLTSETLGRFLNASTGSIDLEEIIQKGKVLLVNLAPSKHLSDENARVFGALLVNEFFEVARRRPLNAGTLKPYYLYLDEFQTFVSLDLTAMLDQVRKYKLFTVLAHQRFGQLDDDLKDAVLTNARIKAVFGGLPVEMAKMMALELFIGELDPMRIKAAIYQTKFWPKYERDKVYTTSTSSGHSTGEGENTVSGESSSSVHGEFFDAQQWMGGASGTSVSAVMGMTSASGSHRNDTEFTGEAQGEADVPIFVPVPFQELSSVQYFNIDEQLTQLTAALKEQFGRHCFIKIHHQKTQPLRVPFVKSHYTTQKAFGWYEQKKLAAEGAQSCAAVDDAIAQQEAELLSTINTPKPSAKRTDPISALLGRE